jgi:opacity protein-like surface antigen
VGGAAAHRSTGIFSNSGGATFTAASGSSTEGFAMVEGGVSFALAPHLLLVPAYRFVHYFSDKEDVAHVAKIGLRYVF